MNNRDEHPCDLKLSMYGTLDEQPVSPENVSLVDLRQMAEDFGKFIKGSDDVNLKDVSVSVEQGCITLSLNNYVDAPTLPQDYKALIDSPNGAIDIDPVRAAVIYNLQALSKGSKDRRYVITYQGKKLTIGDSSDYKINEPVYVDIEDYIYGELYDMGGQIPNIHLVAEDGQKITVPAEKELLMNAGDRLYRKQLVHISAKEDLKTGERKDYTLLSFEDYDPKWDEREFEELVDFYSPKISLFDNPIAIVNAMRGY
jgi:hypothetical protein